MSPERCQAIVCRPGRTPAHAGVRRFPTHVREDWFRLRGYHEYDIFSWHLDTLLEFSAHYGGVREECLPTDHCIYHMEHHYGKARTRPRICGSAMTRDDSIVSAMTRCGC